MLGNTLNSHREQPFPSCHNDIHVTYLGFLWPILHHESKLLLVKEFLHCIWFHETPQFCSLACISSHEHQKFQCHLSPKHQSNYCSCTTHLQMLAQLPCWSNSFHPVQQKSQCKPGRKSLSVTKCTNLSMGSLYKFLLNSWL